MKSEQKAAAHAAYLAAKEQGNLHFGRVRVGGSMGNHKSKAARLRQACRGKAEAFRGIMNAAV